MGHSPWGHNESDTTEQLHFLWKMLSLELKISKFKKALSSIHMKQNVVVCPFFGREC